MWRTTVDRTLGDDRMWRVVVTGCALADTAEGAIETIVHDAGALHRIAMPRLPIKPYGAGDLFAGLLVAHLVLGDDLIRRRKRPPPSSPCCDAPLRKNPMNCGFLRATSFRDALRRRRPRLRLREIWGMPAALARNRSKKQSTLVTGAETDRGQVRASAADRRSFWCARSLP